MATLNGFTSNAVVYSLGEEHRHAFEQGTVTMQDGMTVGSLLKLDTGKYVWAATADAADVVAVLADGQVEASDALEAGDHVLVVAVRSCGLGADYLKYSDGDIDTAGETALKALGMKICSQY